MQQGTDNTHRYDDMLYLPHYVSATHPQMDIYHRAAQFAPFAALTGYENAIAETERLTETRIEIDEHHKEQLDQRLQVLLQEMREHHCPEISVTFFVPDGKKEGGKYATIAGNIFIIDFFARLIIMKDGSCVHIDDIIWIDGCCFRELEQ